MADNKHRPNPLDRWMAQAVGGRDKWEVLSRSQRGELRLLSAALFLISLAAVCLVPAAALSGIRTSGTLVGMVRVVKALLDVSRTSWLPCLAGRFEDGGGRFGEAAVRLLVRHVDMACATLSLALVLSGWLPDLRQRF